MIRAPKYQNLTFATHSKCRHSVSLALVRGREPTLGNVASKTFRNGGYGVTELCRVVPTERVKDAIKSIVLIDVACYGDA